MSERDKTEEQLEVEKIKRENEREVDELYRQFQDGKG